MNASKTIKLMKLASKIVMKEDLPLLKALHEADMKASKTNSQSKSRVSHLITDKRVQQVSVANKLQNPAPASKTKEENKIMKIQLKNIREIAFELGRASAIKEELRFLRGKNMYECLMCADYGCCHEIPEWYQRRIRKLKLAVPTL